jgi:hypothetical protein
MKLSLLLPFLACGCLHAPARHGLMATPPSPAAIAACQKTQTFHNVWSWTGAITGGLAGLGGAATADLSDQTTKVVTGLSAAGMGLVAGLASVAAGLEADAFSQKNCAVLLTE